jgi:hypothetical protein
MRMRTAAIGGLVLTLAAGACGTPDEEPVATVEGPLATVQAASEQTGDLTTYRMSIDVTSEDPGDACAAAIADMVPSVELAVSGTAEDLRVEATDATSGATGRYVDGTAYIEATGLPELESPTAWVSLDSDDLGAAELDLRAFSSLGGEQGEGDIPALSLDAMLDRLEAEGLSATEVGPDEVRGQPATHYAIEADPDAGADAELVSLDVWVDADGYLRRMTATTHDIGLGGDTDREPFFSLPAATLTLEVWDVDAEISIEAPPASEVTPLDDIGPLPDADSLFPADLLGACLPALGD